MTPPPIPRIEAMLALRAAGALLLACTLWGSGALPAGAAPRISDAACVRIVAFVKRQVPPPAAQPGRYACVPHADAGPWHVVGVHWHAGAARRAAGAGAARAGSSLVGWYALRSGTSKVVAWDMANERPVVGPP